MSPKQLTITYLGTDQGKPPLFSVPLFDAEGVASDRPLLVQAPKLASLARMVKACGGDPSPFRAALVESEAAPHPVRFGGKATKALANPYAF